MSEEGDAEDDTDDGAVEDAGDEDDGEGEGDDLRVIPAGVR